jgi:hypothetical protein
MAATTLPTPLYDLYAKRFGLHTLTLPLFAVYAMRRGCDAGPVRITVRTIGRRPVMLGAVVISIVSSLISRSQGLGLLLLGRVVWDLLRADDGPAPLPLSTSPPGLPGAGGARGRRQHRWLALGTLLAGVLADRRATRSTPYLVQAVLRDLGLWTAGGWAPRVGDGKARISQLRVPAELRGNLFVPCCRVAPRSLSPAC